MFENKPIEKWLGKVFKSLEDNFEKYEFRFQIIFAISLALFPTFLSLLASQPKETNMSTFFGWGMTISFYIAVFCGWMLIRNSSKTEANRRLKSIETKLEKLDKFDTLASKLDTLIDEIRKDREERTKGSGKNEL